MPSLTTWAPFCAIVVHVHNVIPVIKTITWLLLSRLQGNKTTLELSGRNLHQHAPELFGTLRNLPNPASGTYTNTHRNSPEPSGTFRDLPEPTFRNLPQLTSWTYASIHWNPPKSSRTCLRNLHQHVPELSGTLRNLPPEPAPATRTGIHRSLSGLKTPLAYAVGEKKWYSSEDLWPENGKMLDTFCNSLLAFSTWNAKARRSTDRGASKNLTLFGAFRQRRYDVVRRFGAPWRTLATDSSETRGCLWSWHYHDYIWLTRSRWY